MSEGESVRDGGCGAEGEGQTKGQRQGHGGGQFVESMQVRGDEGRERESGVACGDGGERKSNTSSGSPSPVMMILWLAALVCPHVLGSSDISSISHSVPTIPFLPTALA